MEFRTVLTLSCLVSTLGIGCSRNRQEAILKANEGDKTIKADTDAAIAQYQEAVQLDPNNHEIWRKLGEAYRKKGDWPKMAEAFSNAINADAAIRKDKKPTFANYFAGRGYAIEQQAKKKTLSYEEAKEPYQKCIDMDPNFAECYFHQGETYLWTDDEQKALEAYTKAIQHDPAQIKFYNPLAALYMSLGYWKEAEQVLNGAKAIANPTDADNDNRKVLADVEQNLATILEGRNDFEGAVKELEVAKSVAPSDSPEAVKLLYSLGNDYANLKEPKKQPAIDNLKGFYARACKGPKAADFKVECQTVQTQVTNLGGTLN